MNVTNKPIIDKDKAISLFNSLNPKCTPILAFSGMRSHALLRILASHREVWWDSTLMNDKGILTKDSLSYPVTKNNFFTDVRVEMPKYLSYSTAQTNMVTSRKLTTNIAIDMLKNYYKHNSLLSYLIFHTDFIDIVNHSFIFLYTSNIKATMQQRKQWYNYDMQSHGYDYTSKNIKLISKPHKSSLAFNIDIHRLFSKNDLIFEMEYIRLVDHFNFTANINRVRSFILLYLEREQYISTF